MCTIEYNGTQTLAIRPSYVCTQDPTECPIPLQWTSIHPFNELPVIKHMIQIQKIKYKTLITANAMDYAECPIPLQWTSIHPFTELPVIKYKIQIQKIKYKILITAFAMDSAECPILL